MAVIGWFPQLEISKDISVSERQISQSILVHLDTQNTPISIIEAFPAFPSRFSLCPSDSTLFCISTKLHQPALTPNILQLDVVWSSTIPQALLLNGRPVFDNDPTKRPAEFEWGNYKTMKTVRYEWQPKPLRRNDPPPAAKPITTSAGEPIFMQIPVNKRVISFSKNVRSVPLFMADEGDFVNSDKVKIGGVESPPGTLLATDINISKPKFEHGRYHYIMSWVFFVDKINGWKERRRNCGFHELKSGYKWKGKEYDTSEEAYAARQAAADAAGVSSFTIGPVSPFSYMEPILIGPLDNRRYPTTPILLHHDGFYKDDNGEPTSLEMTGRAYRTKNEAGYEDPKGQILGLEDTTNRRAAGLTEADFAHEELAFTVRSEIPFNKFFPMR